jgi:hypothetical protein
MTGLLARKNPAPSRAPLHGERPRVTIRLAGPDDASAIRGLARLDSSHAPEGEVLLAEVGGEPWAALSLDDHHAVADPFRPSGELVFLLMERGRAMRRARQGERRGLRRLRLARA